jgi:hypothetical protein
MNAFHYAPYRPCLKCRKPVLDSWGALVVDRQGHEVHRACWQPDRWPQPEPTPAFVLAIARAGGMAL